MVVRRNDRLTWTERLTNMVFWGVALGAIELPEPANWNMRPNESFPYFEGWDHLVPLPIMEEQGPCSHAWICGEYWQRQRVIQVWCGCRLLAEVLLVGVKGKNLHDWEVAGIRYRPQRKKHFDDHTSGRAFEKKFEEQGGELMGGQARSGSINDEDLVYLAPWVYVDPEVVRKHYRPEPLDNGVEFPEPIWPEA